MPRQAASLRFTEVGAEALVYNTVTQEAHSLNQTAALVLRHCDGETPVHEVAALCERELDCQSGEELVRYTLGQLQKKKLVEVCEPGALTRKELLTKVGGLAVALPLVASVAIPSPAMAQSCISPADCQASLDPPNQCFPCGDTSQDCVGDRFCLQVRCTTSGPGNTGGSCSADEPAAVSGGSGSNNVCAADDVPMAVAQNCFFAREIPFNIPGSGQTTAMVGARTFSCPNGGFLYACCQGCT